MTKLTDIANDLDVLDAAFATKSKLTVGDIEEEDYWREAVRKKVEELCDGTCCTILVNPSSCSWGAAQ